MAKRWIPIVGALSFITVSAVCVALWRMHSLDSSSRQAAAGFHASLPTPHQRDVVSVVGDSYSAGSDMNSGIETLWWSDIQRNIPVQFDVLAVGGSGYVAQSPTSTDRSTFVDRAAHVDPTSKEVIVFGSRNDGASNPASVRAAASTTLEMIRRVAPSAHIIVIGPPWVSSTPPTSFLKLRDAVESAALSSHATWIDPIKNDWFPTGSGLIGSDGVHPTDTGHAHLAKLIQPIVERYLAPK